METIFWKCVIASSYFFYSQSALGNEPSRKKRTRFRGERGAKPSSWLGRSGFSSSYFSMNGSKSTFRWPLDSFSLGIEEKRSGWEQRCWREISNWSSNRFYVPILHPFLLQCSRMIVQLLIVAFSNHQHEDQVVIVVFESQIRILLRLRQLSQRWCQWLQHVIENHVLLAGLIHCNHAVHINQRNALGIDSWSDLLGFFPLLLQFNSKPGQNELSQRNRPVFEKGLRWSFDWFNERANLSLLLCVEIDQATKLRSIQLRNIELIDSISNPKQSEKQRNCVQEIA